MTPNAPAERTAPYPRIPVDVALALGTGTVLLAVGVFVAASAPGQGIYGPGGPGAGFVTLFVGLGLVALSVTYLVQHLRGVVRARRDDAAARASAQHGASAAQSAVAAAAGTGTISTIDFGVDEPASRSRWTPVAIVLSLVALAVVVELLGFQLSMLLFLMFHLRVLGKQGWIVSVIISLAGSFGVFALFTRVLRVALPAASIDFLNMMGL